MKVFTLSNIVMCEQHHRAALNPICFLTDATVLVRGNFVFFHTVYEQQHMKSVYDLLTRNEIQSDIQMGCTAKNLCMNSITVKHSIYQAELHLHYVWTSLDTKVQQTSTAVSCTITLAPHIL